MNRNTALLGFLFCLGLSELHAQSFSFYSTMRAGRPNGGDWTVGMGNQALGQLSTANFSYQTSGTRHWSNGGFQDFRIGWDATTNTAYTTVLNVNGAPTTVTYQNNGSPVPTDSTWTLPAGGFFASATPNIFNPSPSSILLQGLTLSPNVNVISGALPSTIGAEQPGNPRFSQMSAPLVLDASANGGSWYVAGSIRFTGLVSQPGGTAAGSRLQFFLNATSSSNPEPGSLLLLGGGLSAIVAYSRRLKIAKS